MGPNSGLGPVAQALAYARALTCHSGTQFDRAFSVAVAQLNDPANTTNDVWHTYVSTDGTYRWSWIVSRGRGRSQRCPPPGEPTAATVTFDITDTAFRTFTDIVDGLQDGSLIDQPPVTADQLMVLHGAIATREPDFSLSLTNTCLAALRTASRRRPAPGVAELRHHIALAIALVRQERRDYAADVKTTTGLHTTLVLIDRVLGRIPQLGLEYRQFVRICQPLLGSQITDAWDLLAQTCSRLADAGLHELLAEVAEERRTSSAEAITHGLASPDMNGHLDQLHVAALHTFTAMALYGFLAAMSPDPADATRHRKIATSLDERLVRVHYAITNQLIDLNTDAIWNRHRRLVQLVREQVGPVGVQTVLDDLTKTHLFYPYAIAARLTTEAAVRN